MGPPWKRRLSRDSDAMFRLHRLAACLALTTALPSPASAWSVDEAYKAFWDAGYGDCDAFVLGKLWIVSPDDAKFRGGSMILNRHRPALDAAMEEANAVFSCASPGAMEEPDELAEFWLKPSGW